MGFKTSFKLVNLFLIQQVKINLFDGFLHSFTKDATAMHFFLEGHRSCITKLRKKHLINHKIDHLRFIIYLGAAWSFSFCLFCSGWAVLSRAQLNPHMYFIAADKVCFREVL